MADPLGGMDEDAPPEPVIPLDPELEELWSSRALLLVLLLLILSFWVSYYLKVRRIKSVHETLVALFAGGFIGLIVRLSPGTVVQNMISFKNTILLNVLLPPIILNSGFELRQANFFRNFGVILAFAFAGTFISAVVLGVLVYIWALLGFEGLSLGIIECLIFGSTLSATDPVTVLAIFNTLKVDPTLYSIIFGESLLNDAVAIVMFETLSQFHGEHISIFSFFHGVGIFLLIFLTSMALGVVFGLACSLMLKHSRLNEYPELESCLVILIAYTSYFFSNGLTMSGIVSLLFCGITLKHYAYHNMSKRAQRTSKYMFGTLAQLCENFIFIYLGLSLFTQTDLVYKPVFILVTTIAACAARWMAVFPISKLINIGFRARGQRSEELPQSYQMMLFWAGLRGAVGVALAAGIKGHNAKSLRTTVLVTVVISLVFFGGTIGRMVEITGIRTGVHEEDDDESSDEEGPLGVNGGYRASDGPYRDGTFRNDSTLSLQGQNGKRYNSFRGVGDDSDDDDAEVLPSATSTNFNELTGQSSADGVWRDGQWFNALDEQYLLPVFSNATASRRQATRKAMRSTARLTQHGNDSFVDENESERDLTSLSREGSRSPWDASPTDARQGQGSTGAAPLGRDGAPPSGQGKNSRGFVNDYSHHPAPSLSAAVSSLFSMSPVSSSTQHHNPTERETSFNDGDNATVLPLSSASTRNLHGEDQMQMIAVPDGSLSYATDAPLAHRPASLANFRMPKRRTSDDHVQQSVTSPSATRTRGTSSSSSPLREGYSPQRQHDGPRLSSNPATASIIREDALQRRLSAPISRTDNAGGDEQHDTVWRNDRSQSSTGHY